MTAERSLSTILPVATSKRINLTVRVYQSELDALDALVAAMPVIGNRHTLAHEALRLGIELIQAKPDVLLKKTRRSK